LGPYRILDRLGSGGMGQVYKAEHILMKRVVALKVIAPHLVGDAGELARFQSEIQLAARLTHQNIVTAYDAAEANGLHFLAVEYVDGIDLARLIERRGPLSVSMACEYIRQVALGLQHAHEHGLVHCDIKPSNLLVRHGRSQAEAPVVKILDFGLARLMGSGPEKRTPAYPEFDGGLAGTPDYLAPEIAQDCSRADVRSDLYSLGCTFFHLLTGRVPYPGGTWAEKLLRHHADPVPSAAKVRPEVPAEIALLVQQLMAKDPADRCRSPAEVAKVLQNWLGGKRKSRPLWPRAFWPVAVGAAVGVGLAISWAARPGPRSVSAADAISRSSPVLIKSHVLVESLPGKTFSRLDTAVAAARDGDTLVIHGDGPFPTRPIFIRGKALTLRAAAGFRPRVELTHTSQEPSWQPLFRADCPLVIEGLELCSRPNCSPHSETRAEHLVYCEGAPLRLVDCHLLAPSGSALIVCRRARDLELRNCTIVAGASAICLEPVGGRSHAIRLLDNHITVCDPVGAALCIWKPDYADQATVRIHLAHNEIETGRLLALAGLNRCVEVEAERNSFRFRQALLSCLSSPEGALRPITRWQGRENHYRGSGDWVAVNGRPAGVHGLRAWRELWGDAETESVEEPLSTLR
jgi:serine/threonine protein kinase